MRRRLSAWWAALFAAPACAQDYPTKPIRLLIPFAPGGTGDIIARPLAQKMSESLGHNLVIENRGGAGGVIAASVLAKSPADGYTLMLASSGAITMQPTYTRLPYDPVADFTPVGQVVLGQMLLQVHPNVPARNVQELIALAKSRPKGLTYGSSGGVGYLAGELFNTLAGSRMVHVAYRGGGPLLVDMLSGQIDLSFSGLSGFVLHARAGRTRGLAVTGLKRSTAMPELPTVAESGLAGYEATTFWGFLAPAKLPAAHVRRINQAMVDAVKQADLTNYYVSQGNEPVAGTPEAFAQVIKLELEKWGRLIKVAGITGL